jgi:hypothetical protein
VGTLLKSCPLCAATPNSTPSTTGAHAHLHSSHTALPAQPRCEASSSRVAVGVSQRQQLCINQPLLQQGSTAATATSATAVGWCCRCVQQARDKQRELRVACIVRQHRHGVPVGAGQDEERRRQAVPVV